MKRRRRPVILTLRPYTAAFPPNSANITFPIQRTMSRFDDWLESGLVECDPESGFSAAELVGFFTRFNRDVREISKDWSDPEMARAVWHLYGSGSCHLAEMSRLPPGPELTAFFNSVLQLYSDLFEVRCSLHFSHLDRGPEPANPLNGPCYMLWDMDCGIGSFQFSGVASHVDHSIRLLEQLSASPHPATVESAIHGLGHMIDDFRSRCQPVLERILLRSDVPGELRDYAHDAIHHYIQ